MYISLRHCWLLNNISSNEKLICSILSRLKSGVLTMSVDVDGLASNFTNKFYLHICDMLNSLILNSFSYRLLMNTILIQICVKISVEIEV